MINEKSNQSGYSNMLSNLLNNIPYSAFCKNSRHEIVALNDFSAEIYGYTRKDMIGKSDQDFFPSSECAVFQRVDNEVFNTGNIIANREVVTDKSGYVHHINTKKGKIRTIQGDELVIGISYTRDDSNLYNSDTHQDEYFNNNTLECIEKLTDTFNSLNIERESNRRYFQTLNIDNAYHLLSRDKEFLNEFINRIPYYACYVSDHSSQSVINNKLERFINDSRGLKHSTIDNTNNFQELNNILFYSHHPDSKG